MAYQNGFPRINQPPVAPGYPAQAVPTGVPQPGMPCGLVPPVFFRKPTLPVEPADYARFWRSPAYRLWQSIIVLLLGIVLFFVASLVFSVVAVIIDASTGRQSFADLASGGMQGLKITPAIFVANNLGLAALILIAILAGRGVMGQPAGYISSVLGRFRWKWLGRCLLVILPLWIVYHGVSTYLASMAADLPELHSSADTMPLLIGILLTTPLQCAGEEYGFRGLANRAVASLFGNEKVGWAVGAVVSSLLFMAAHVATDLWLNLFYFTFGLAACVMVWKTGGLEASIALHIINNVLAMGVLPWIGLEGLFDRGSGTAGPEVLIGIVAVALATGLVWWQSDRAKIARLAAPGTDQAAQIAAAQVAFVQTNPQWTQPPLAAAPGLLPLPGAPNLLGPAAAQSPAPVNPAGSDMPVIPAEPAGRHDLPMDNPRPWEDGQALPPRA